MEKVKVPKIYKGMKLVKAYPNIILYQGKLWKEAFTYSDLGIDKGEKQK